MNQRVIRGVVAVAACGLLAVPVASAAEEAARAIPTLLIKGEVVAVDHNDPSAPLLKVKDRYGFETPIYLTTDTKVTQGDQASTVESLSQGASVEVEYNFDINTAKRHAVSVKLSGPAGSEAAASASAPAVMPETTAPEAELAMPEAATPDMPAASMEPAPTDEPPAEETPSDASAE